MDRLENTDQNPLHREGLMIATCILLWVLQLVVLLMTVDAINRS